MANKWVQSNDIPLELLPESQGRGSLHGRADLCYRAWLICRGTSKWQVHRISHHLLRLTLKRKAKWECKRKERHPKQLSCVWPDFWDPEAHCCGSPFPPSEPFVCVSVLESANNHSHHCIRANAASRWGFEVLSVKYLPDGKPSGFVITGQPAWTFVFSF